MTPEQIERVLTNTDEWLEEYAQSNRESVLNDKPISPDQLRVVVRAFTKRMAEDYDRAPRRWTARDAGPVLTANVKAWSEALNLTGTELAVVLGDYVEYLEEAHHLRSAKAIATALIKAGVGSEAVGVEAVDHQRVDAVISLTRQFFNVADTTTDAQMLKAHLAEAILLGADLTFTDIALLALTAETDADLTVKAWLEATVLPLFNLARVKTLLEEQLGEKLTDEAVRNYELTSFRASETPVVGDQRLAIAATVAGTPLVTGDATEVGALVTRYHDVMVAVPDLAKFVPAPKQTKQQTNLKKGLSMKAAKKLRSKSKKKRK